MTAITYLDNSQSFPLTKAKEVLSPQETSKLIDECAKILKYADFFVNGEDELDGYCSYNLIGRVILWLYNLCGDETCKKAAAKKIEEIFYKIVTSTHPYSCDPHDPIGRQLKPYYFSEGIFAGFCSTSGHFNDLIKKVQNYFPEVEIDSAYGELHKTAAIFDDAKANFFLQIADECNIYRLQIFKEDLEDIENGAGYSFLDKRLLDTPMGKLYRQKRAPIELVYQYGSL